MRLKLDENLGRAAAELVARAGHDVASVATQRMSGTADGELFERCVAEGRCLVTLDLDFANPFRFDPARGAGVAVLRVPDLPGQRDILACLARLVGGLERADVAGRLWIVDRERVRQYEPGDGVDGS